MTNELAIRILTGDVLGTTEQTQEAVTMAVKALSQPDVTDINVGDTISRQAAIDAAMKEVSDKRTHGFNAGATRAANNIKTLPSVQPDRSLLFRIGEICVDESKWEITAEVAVEKIRMLLRAERRENG